MKNRVVLFNKYGARILINPHDIAELRKLPNCIVNPDLSRVRGLPPHMWEQHDQAVLPKDPNMDLKYPISAKFGKLHLNKWVTVAHLLLGTINLGLLLRLILKVS